MRIFSKITGNNKFVAIINREEGVPLIYEDLICEKFKNLSNEIISRLPYYKIEKNRVDLIKDQDSEYLLYELYILNKEKFDTSFIKIFVTSETINSQVYPYSPTLINYLNENIEKIWEKEKIFKLEFPDIWQLYVYFGEYQLYIFFEIDLLHSSLSILNTTPIFDTVKISADVLKKAYTSKSKTNSLIFLE